MSGPCVPFEQSQRILAVFLEGCPDTVIAGQLIRPGPRPRGRDGFNARDFGMLRTENWDKPEALFPVLSARNTPQRRAWHWTPSDGRWAQLILEKDIARMRLGPAKYGGIEIRTKTSGAGGRRTFRWSPGTESLRLLAEVWERTSTVPLYFHHRWIGERLPGELVEYVLSFL